MFTNLIQNIEKFCLNNDPMVGPAGHENYVSIINEHLGDKSQQIAFLENFTSKIDKNIRTGKSLNHENGFTKISMYKFSSGAQLRLHIFPLHEFIDSSIHSHRWNLSSYILSGEMKCKNFRLITENDEHKIFKFYDEIGGTKQCELDSKVGLVSDAQYVLFKGCSHFLNFKVMHQISKTFGSRTVSLMLSGSPQSDYSLISRSDGYQIKNRKFLTNIEITNKINEVIATHLSPAIHAVDESIDSHHKSILSSNSL